MKNIENSEITEKKFSYFNPPIQNITPSKTIDLRDVFNLVTQDKELQGKTENYRKTKDIEIKKSLPFITTSGVFSQRNNDKCTAKSGIICIDLDHLTEKQMNDVCGYVSYKDLFCKMYFVSPSGDGLKLFFGYDVNQDHELTYLKICTYLQKEYELTEKNIDTKCKDLARACFLCYDDKAMYFEHNSKKDIDITIYDKTPYEKPKELTTTTTQRTANHVPTTQTVTDHDIFEWCFTEHSKNKTYTKGERNQFINGLAVFCNEYGVSLQTCINQSIQRLKDSDQDNKTDFENVIKSAYNSHSANHGSKSYSKFTTATSTNILQPTKFVNTVTIDKDANVEIESPTTPPFPVEVFPKEIQNYISQFNQLKGFPIDYLAGSMLFATSTAIGNTRSLRIDSTYSASACLWIAIVGLPGTIKSPTMKTATRPLVNYDSEITKNYFKELAKFQIDFDEWNNAKKGERGEKPSEPAYKQLIGDDTTFEKMVDILNVNPMGIGIFKDELKTFFDEFSRYKSSGTESKMLSIFDSTPLKVQRKTGDNKNIYIEKPYVSIIGGIQPEVLKKTLQNSVDNGLTQRFLYCYPEYSLIPYYDSNNIDTTIYTQIIDNLIDLRMGTTTTQEIKFSQSAKKLFIEIKNEIVDRKNFENLHNPNTMVSSILSKMDTYIPRFALNLQLFTWASGDANDNEIDLFAVEGAYKLFQYFEKMSIKVHNLFEVDKNLLNEKNILIHLREKTGREYKEILEFYNSNVLPGTFRQWCNRK